MAVAAAAFVSASTAAAAAPVRRSNSDKLVMARRHRRTAGIVTSATSTSDNNSTIITTGPAAAAAEERSPSRRDALATALAALAFSTTAQAAVTRPAAAAEDRLPKVMVVGATGQTGALVVKTLVKRGGSDVIAAVRSPDKARKMGLDAGGVTLLPAFDVTGRGAGFFTVGSLRLTANRPSPLHQNRRTVFEVVNTLLHVQASRATSTRVVSHFDRVKLSTVGRKEAQERHFKARNARTSNGWKPLRVPLPTKGGKSGLLVLRTCCTIVYYAQGCLHDTLHFNPNPI